MSNTSNKKPSQPNQGTPNTPVNDPLEAARIGGAGSTEIGRINPPGVAAAAETPPSPPPEKDDRPAPTPPPAPGSSKRLPYFKVVADKQVSWFGQMITLHAGDVISDESYGEGAMERLRETGVALEEVDPPV